MSKHRSVNPSIRRMVALACAATVAHSALAADDGLEEVVVTGMRASLRQSIAVKQADDHIVEVIAADNMGQLPNVTVAESLVRLPGVNGARDRGNESLATVRGLGPRMTMGTVNGREVASSEPTRAVRWEIFPTEVVSTVKVYKTQSADLIAGGVAATIDVGTLNPLDYTGPKLVLTGGPVYYSEGKDVPHYSPWGDRLGATWIGRLGDNLAIAIGATYQKQKNANALMGSWGYTDASNSKDVNGDGTLDPTPWGGADELKQIDQTRTGAVGVLQWRGEHLDVKLDALYSKIKIKEDQNQTWFNNWAYSIWSGGNPYTTPGSSYTIIDGDVVAGTLANSYNEVDHVVGRYTEDKDLLATGLNMRWTGESWTVGGDVSFSAAKRDNLWQAIKLVAFPATVSYDFRSGSAPFISISSDALNDSPAPTWSSSIGMSAGPGELRDQIGALALNAHRRLEGGAFTALDMGARVASREKKYQYASYNLPGLGAPLSAFDSLLYSFRMPDLNVPTMLGANLDALAAVAVGGWNPALSQVDPLQGWKVKEDTTEGYIKGVYDTQAFGVHMSGNVGVRLVHVATTSTGVDNVGGSNTPARDTHDTTDVLPSATLNFLLDDKHVLRLAAAKVVARPPLDELRTGRYLDPVTNTGQLTGSGANPHLDPFRAVQFDVSYEWYFHKEAMLALAGYTKSVQSSIGYKSGHETINGHDYLISGPFNGGGGFINGVEVTFQTPFYFWPALENFGVYSNYSYVSSNLQEFSPAANPLPLSGLAKDTAAVDLWYSNRKVELRLGYKYHSPYTIIYGWNETALSRLESERILDFSAGWQATESFGLKLQVGNLTNEKLRAYFDNQPNRLANKDATGGYQAFGRRYALELTYRL
ncbi:MAG: hypothetical protein RL684_483 [Pseudomonadota bacterium]|jgi:TonB-dependent receptor